jgi:CspA family cold shock protein
MMDRALTFWFRHPPSSAAPFPKPELPGPSVGPLLAGSHHARERLLAMRISGTVKFFNVAKGFGFITPVDGSKDVFVHASALEAAGIRSLSEGDEVTFILEDDRKGRGKQAEQIQKA